MFVDPNGESATAAFIAGCIIIGVVGNVAAQILINASEGEIWYEDIDTATYAGVASGFVGAITTNPTVGAGVGKVVSSTAKALTTGLSTTAGTLVTVASHKLKGHYDGVNGANVFYEDLANGVLAYGSNKIAGAFIKTNSAWFQPKRLVSFFSKSYGQKIIKQTLASSAISTSIITMYENGIRNVKAIQEFLGITVDGSYGPETRGAVKQFQQELVNMGYLQNTENAVDGQWGPNTDKAFFNYINDNVMFIK